VVKIKNTNATESLLVSEEILKETTLAPGEEMETDPATKVLSIENIA
jgi:hypothetical protein